MFEGYFGYSLPDDLLSGIGLRAALSSITLGMPIIGTWMHWALFGGDFPCGDHAIGAPDVRAAHPADPRHHPGADRRAPGAGVVPEAPSSRPRPHRTNVVGVRVMPVFAIKSGAFFAMVGILGLMGGLLQINPIWNSARTSRRRCRRAASPTST
jgi:ubiquinol-cytochrome c reductase cytochrome b subunit